MPSFEEVCERVDWLRANKKCRPGEKCTFVLVERETRKRIKNTEGRTKLIVQLDTPETYSEFAAQFARYKERTGNPQVAYQIMLDLLKALPDASIERMSQDAGTQAR